MGSGHYYEAQEGEYRDYPNDLIFHPEDIDKVLEFLKGHLLTTVKGLQPYWSFSIA